MASANLQPLQGMSDIVAPEVCLWQWLEDRARGVFRLYGFDEIRTPVLEQAGVFVRALGEGAEVVQKEMYVFEDRGGRTVCLRPEGTAGVMRFAAGAGGQDLAPSRLFYIGPMFRCERPQAGRKRQFHQLGVESLGAPNPALDAECIALQVQLLSAFGLKDCAIQLNSRGTPEDRAAVLAGLRAGLAGQEDGLCDDCRRRLNENPLRVLDCKQEGCRTAVAGLPPVTEFMAPESRAYLAAVEALLQRLEIPVRRNPLLVRGLDYYVHTVWEITHASLGAQDALAGGGRYRIDSDGRAVEGVGFAMGIERLLMALQSQGMDPATLRVNPAVWIVTAGPAAAEENLVLLQTLRRRGVACGMDLAGRSVKAQMRAANRADAGHVILRGDDEMAQGTFVVKNMRDGTQEIVDLPALMQRVAAWAQPA